MGSIIYARCSCGYEVGNIVIGRSMRSHCSSDFYPALCQDCSSIISIDLNGTKRCPSCRGTNVIFYNDQRLSKNNSLPSNTNRDTSVQGDIIEMQVTSHELTKRIYRCPKCMKLALNFHETGILWD